MLKKSARIVLASLPGAVKRETSVSRGAAALLGIRRVSARQGWAGEKSGLFEHPARALLFMSERSFFLCRRNGGQLFISRAGWIKNQTRAIVPTYI
jgi:hypothetical protein